MSKNVPEQMNAFRAAYPTVWQAFESLGKECHENGGPLDEKTRRLVKLGIAIASQHEGAVHSAVRHAMEAGVTRDEMLHAAILAITTIGWPKAYAAVTWIDDVLG